MTTAMLAILNIFAKTMSSIFLTFLKYFSTSSERYVKLYEYSMKYQQRVKKKLAAYHCHIQLGVIAQGVLMYLASMHPQKVWRSFGSWLRTIRPDLAPSELVTSIALRNTLPKFLLGSDTSVNLKKFVLDRIDLERSEGLRLVA